jgi:hypothetical protein
VENCRVPRAVAARWPAAEHTGVDRAVVWSPHVGGVGASNGEATEGVTSEVVVGKLRVVVDTATGCSIQV